MVDATGKSIQEVGSMQARPEFKIAAVVAGIGWPRGYCTVRGDLGCLGNHAKAAGYRADGLAVNLNVAPRLLRRVFKDAFGIALKNWLVQVRAVEVRRRLLGSESIEEIAMSVGFSHAKELAREFRKVYGVTPLAYRIRERGRENGSRKPEAGSRKRVTARAFNLRWRLRRRRIC